MKKLLSSFIFLLAFGMTLPAQNPQTQAAPIYAVNAKYVNGTAPGYWATQQSITNGSGGTIAAASGLNINLGPGTANCGSGSIVTYAGGTFTLTPSTTNRLYLDTTSSCVPAVKTSAFTGSDIPLSVIVTSGSGITSIADVRTPFGVPGSSTTPQLLSSPLAQFDGLVGAFTDSGGNVIEPVWIGKGPVTLSPPTGSTQLQLGVNDDANSDNGGSWVIDVNGTNYTVLGTSAPWVNTGGLNPSYPLNLTGATAPIVVTGLTANDAVIVQYVSGTVTDAAGIPCSASTGSYDAGGDSNCFYLGAGTPGHFLVSPPSISPNPMVAAGDVVVGGPNGYPVRVPGGTGYLHQNPLGTFGWDTPASSGSLNVNGSPVSNPNLQDNSSVTFSVFGSNINATANGATGSSFNLPLSIYNIGTGMNHITDSTGPGGVLIGAGAPTNGSGAQQCPGPSNANWGQVYLRSDASPFTYYDCNSNTSVWDGPELPIGSSTERLFTIFNQKSTRSTITADYPYPGTHYSNSSGIINTGNAPCATVFAKELFAWETPSGDASVTYLNQCGIADYLAWTAALGFSPETNAPVFIAGAVIAAITFEGSPKYGFIPAQSSTATSGTWTNLDPTSATTTVTGTVASGSTSFALTSGVPAVHYYRVTDVTNPSAIAPGTYVTVGGSPVTISSPTLASMTGDTLKFMDPSSAPFVAGYGVCATGSGVRTFNLPAAVGAVYLDYLVDGTPGTATATYSVDGGATTGSLSSGDGATFSNGISQAWFGKRLPVSGTGTHTVAVTVTSGTFCVLGVSVPNPAQFNGLNPLPRVVQELIPPAGSGYNANDLQIHDSVKAVVAQMALDGYNVIPADFFLGWPEAYGVTSYFEHNVGSYGNGMTGSYAASPHFNNLGNRLNADVQAQASGILPFRSVPDSVGYITVDNSVPGQQKLGLNITNIDILNRSQTHTVGNQQINTGDINKNALILKGSQTSGSTPPLNSIVRATTSGSNCIGNITGTAGDVIIVATITGTTSGVAGTQGETYTLVVTNTSNNNATVWKGTFATSGTSSLTVTSTNCRAATFINVGPGVSVDGTPATNFSSSVPNPFTTGTITTANPSDLLINFYMTDAFGSGCGNSPISLSSGWTLSDFNSVSDRISTMTSTTVGASPGSYSMSFNPNSSSCTGGNTTLALTGPGTQQVADLFLLEDSGGNVLSAFDANGRFRGKSTTVSALPTCNSTTAYTTTFVTDASSPTFNATVTGGSTTKVAVYCDGTNWKAY